MPTVMGSLMPSPVLCPFGALAVQAVPLGTPVPLQPRVAYGGIRCIWVGTMATFKGVVHLPLAHPPFLKEPSFKEASLSEGEGYVSQGLALV